METTEACEYARHNFIKKIGTDFMSHLKLDGGIYWAQTYSSSNLKSKSRLDNQATIAERSKSANDFGYGRGDRVQILVLVKLLAYCW